MYAIEIIILLLSVIIVQSENLTDAESVLNENVTPIIGILSLEVSPLIKRTYTDQNYSSYIAASYIKFVEGAGGRVVPIRIGKERSYYEDIMTKINGVIFPGGATYFNNSNGYAAVGKYIFDIAIDMNNHGIYMPIWGTCLGFELLGYLSAGQIDILTECSSLNQASPIEFVDGYSKSRMFQSAPKNIIKNLETQPVTSNFHIFCITEMNFTSANLNYDWNILSFSYDWDGLRYISAMEHKKYPFYGVQFHPEKNLYEFIMNRNITHTANAILVSQYFADFIVNEARKNKNFFINKTEEMNQLIYNYQPIYSGIKGSVFAQIYLFSEDSNSLNSIANSQKKNQFFLNQIIITIGKKLISFLL